MTNTTMTGADVSALIECHKLAHAQEMAALQAKCDAMEADARRYHHLCNTLRDRSIWWTDESLDDAIKAKEAEQAIERS